MWDDARQLNAIAVTLGSVTERVLRGLEHITRDFEALSPPDPLTKREVEVLRLMAGGYSNRELPHQHEGS